MKDLTYIEEYIKNRKNDISDLNIKYYIKPDGEGEYWVRLYMKDAESVEFIVRCSSFEEAIYKIANLCRRGYRSR